MSENNSFEEIDKINQENLTRKIAKVLEPITLENKDYVIFAVTYSTNTGLISSSSLYSTEAIIKIMEFMLDRKDNITNIEQIED